MSPMELARLCAEAAAAKKKVQLVLPRRATGRRGMRLFGKVGPICEVACENPAGQTVVWADPVEVLAFMAAKGIITVRVKGAKSESANES